MIDITSKLGYYSTLSSLLIWSKLDHLQETKICFPGLLLLFQGSFTYLTTVLWFGVYVCLNTHIEIKFHCSRDTYLDRAGTGTPLARIDGFPRTTGTSAFSEPPFKYVSS